MLFEQRSQFDYVMRRLYEVISFPESGSPDWVGMKELFFPWARVTRVTPEALDELDIEGFEAMVSEFIESGVLTSFYEVEISRRVECFGNVAHVLSAYETKRSPDASTLLGSGLNSIQLVWVSDRWRIVSLLWDEGSRKCPIILNHFQPMEQQYGHAD
jgi:hypothetical protein